MRMTVQLDPDVVERIRVRMHDAQLTFDEALNEVVRAGLRELTDDARLVDGPSTRPVPSIGDTVTGGTADPDLRRSLVQDLVAEIHEEPFQPQHRQQPFRGVVRGWPSRLEAYFWPDPGTNYEVTHQLMTPWFEEAGELSERLLAEGSWTAVERKNATRLAWTMLEWGRVTRQSGFSESTVERVFRRALGLPGAGAVPMNSGWTKVAAMATAFLEGSPTAAPHVIWDSRVSTSIVSRLDRRLYRLGAGDPQQLFPRIGVASVGRGGTRPRPLRLGWAYAYGSWTSQDAGSELVRELRDHLNSGGYPAMPSPGGGVEPWTIRGVESVLFMDGY